MADLRRPLSDREIEVIANIGLGLTRHQVAKKMGIAPNTVGSHMLHIYHSTGAHSAAEALAATIARGELNVPLVRGAPLTERQQKILIYIAKGYTNVEIARELGRCRQTVRNDIADMYSKLNAKSRPHLVYLGFRSGNLTINRRKNNER